MPQAVLATISPPAIFRTGSDMPKKYNTKRPKNRNVTRMTNTQRPVLKAVIRRSLSVQDDVMLKKIGTPPGGSTMGNNARNVAAAECGSVRRNWPSAWVEVIESVGFERVEDLYPEALEILFVSRSDAEPVDSGGRCDHSILPQRVGLPGHQARPLPETSWIHGHKGERPLHGSQPRLDLAGLGGVPSARQLHAGLQFSHCHRRKKNLLDSKGLQPGHNRPVRLGLAQFGNHVCVQQIANHLKSGWLKSVGGRRAHLTRLGRTMSNRGPGARSNSLMLGRLASCIRRHSSMGTRTAASTPRRVTTCGPFLSAALRNSLKRDFASCNCQVLTGGFLQRNSITSQMTSQLAIGIPRAPWPHAPAQRSKLPTVGAPAPRRPCPEPHSRRESLLRRTLCILPERKSRGETRDGAGALQAQAEHAQRRAAPDSTERDLAADSSASPKSSPRHLENVSLPRSLHSDRAHALRICPQPFFWRHRGSRQSLFHILHSRRAARRHRPCAAPAGRRLSPSPVRKRNPDRQTL